MGPKVEHHATDLEKLRSAVGARAWVEPSNWGYRNRYAAPASGPDREALERLLVAGLVEKGSEGNTITMFYVTAAGCDAIGLTAEQKARALEP